MNPSYLNSWQDSKYYQYLKTAERTVQPILFVYLLQNYSRYKSLLQRIWNDPDLQFLFSNYYLEIIQVSMQKKEYDLLEFVSATNIYDFLEFFDLENYYADFLNYLLKNEAKMEWLFQSFNQLESQRLCTILKILSSSLFYSKLFLKYKNDLYAHFLELEPLKTEKQQASFQTLILILDEILQKTKLNFYDFQYLKKGSFSKPYQLGDLVFKVGKTRFVHEIPNHDRILIPMFRRPIRDLNCYIEITFLVDKTKVTNADAYQVFKELYDQGIYWIDCRADNLGRLIHSNASYDFDIAPETLGLQGSISKIRLPGDLVILDTDMLYYKDQVPWEELETEGIETRWFHIFENRYLQEKASLSSHLK